MLTARSVVIAALLAAAGPARADDRPLAEPLPTVLTGPSGAMRAAVRDWLDHHPIVVRPTIYASQAAVAGGPNFVITIDDDGSLAATTWNDPNLAGSALQLLSQKYYEVQPDNVNFIITFTEWDIKGFGAFYVPEANDVTGIGYENEGRHEVYDNTGDSPLEGQLLMNSINTWGNGNLANWVFGQELSHRWAAFVRFKDEVTGKRNDALLGRDLQHWSYFMETGGSPMEGNHWDDNGDGTYTTDGLLSKPAVFMPLDLYLMGMVPATDVMPLTLLVPPTPDVSDGFRGTVNRASQPEGTGRHVTISARPRTVTVEQIIAAEGTRSPAWDKSPHEFHLGFQLVVRPGHQYHQSLLALMESRVKSATSSFEKATGNRVKLIVESHGVNPELGIPGQPCPAGAIQCDPDRTAGCVTPPSASPPDGGVTPVCAAACSAEGTCPTGCCLAAGDGNSYCFGASVCGPDGGVVMPAVFGGGSCSVDPRARGFSTVWGVFLALAGVVFRSGRRRARTGRAAGHGK